MFFPHGAELFLAGAAHGKGFAISISMGNAKTALNGNVNDGVFAECEQNKS